tara:strand:- start:140 stop:1801 length:1662 start_codon:yes stop_codon:yes gene_type:complete
MAYKQHRSPFNNNLKGSFTNPNTRNNASGNLSFPEDIVNETADGTTVEETTGEEDENTEKGMNDDMIESIDNSNRVEEDLKASTDWRKNKQSRRQNKRQNNQLVRKLERGERKGELSADAKKTLAEAQERQRFQDKNSGKGKTVGELEGEFQDFNKRDKSVEPMVQNIDKGESVFNTGALDWTGTAMYKQNDMDNKDIKYGVKHLRSKGGAFPMVASEQQANPYGEPINRAGRGPESNQLTNDPNIMQPTNRVANSTFNTNKMFGDIASNAGNPHMPGTMQPQHKTGYTPAYGQPAKALVGDQDQLPAQLQNAIKNSGPSLEKGKVKLDGEEVSYNKGGMRENLTNKGVIGKDGKITPQIMKKAEDGDYGNLAEKQANFAENAFGFKGTAMHSKNHAHTKITKGNVKSAEKDDAAHIEYLKQDINYDSKHGGSDKQMTDDEKHISKLAGDLKYDNYTKRKYDNTGSALSMKMQAPYKQIKYSHSFSDSPMNMGPFEETEIVPNTKTVAQDQSSIDSVKKKNNGVIIKGTGSMGEKIKMKSKHKRNKTKLKAKF